MRAGNPSTRVVVGLGNAEPRYARTRHNIGARVVAEAIRRLGLRPQPGLVPIPLSRSGFVLPDGFMNDSGSIVRRAVERWHPSPSGLLIVHDDLDLPPGEIREKDGGGHGGHNGLRDISQRLGSSDYRRLRIGIGRPPDGMEAADFVLASFRPDERDAIDAAVLQAVEFVLTWILPRQPGQAPA